MAEVLAIVSAIQAATQLLEQAFRILGRLNKAIGRQKALAEVLRRHEYELNGVKTIIGIIDDETNLHTANVVSELIRLKEIQSKLVKLLEKLDPKSTGTLKQCAHQFRQGSADEKKLGDIMDELGHVKSMLLLRIQVANVGLMRNVERQLVANAGVVERIDRFLKEELGEGKGLKIARLLQGRRPSNDGTVLLTSVDLQSLGYDIDDEQSADGTLVDDTNSHPDSIPKIEDKISERIILRNSAKHQALQINGAVGEDIWNNINRLVIKDNVAEDNSIQVNHSTTLEVFRSLVNRQNARIPASV